MRYKNVLQKMFHPDAANPAASVRQSGGNSVCVALVTMTNDFTFRLVMQDEYANRVGPYGAKPPRPFAPVAVTPAALGDGGARDYVPGSTCR